ncbi:MAG: hypothetical protein AAGA56_02995 [Myxococcota bacterium]
MLLGCSSTGDDEDPPTCTLVGCSSNLVGVVDGAALAQAYPDELSMGPLDISLCQEGQTCGTFQLRLADVDPADGTACVPTNSTAGGAQLLCCEDDDHGCRTSPDGELHLTMPLPAEQAPARGYSAALADTNGSPLGSSSGDLEVFINQPNGPECGPTCYTGVASLDALWGG